MLNFRGVTFAGSCLLFILFQSPAQVKIWRFENEAKGELLDFVGILDSMFLKLIGSKMEKYMKNLLRGSGYLGYVDSNQGYNHYKWVICPLTRGYKPTYNQLPTVSWTSKYVINSQTLMHDSSSCLIFVHIEDWKSMMIMILLTTSCTDLACT